MKLTITREDLRQFVLKEANIDITQVPLDIDIEGYKLDSVVNKKLYYAKRMLNGIYGIPKSNEDRKVITDKEGRVLDIVKEEEEPEKPKTKDTSANLKNHPDYTNYENTVLDFATSNEHKRQVPFFGAETIHCCKARYQKMIDKLNVKDSVKFSRIDSLPYLVKREGQESMNDILNEGVNK